MTYLAGSLSEPSKPRGAFWEESQIWVGDRSKEIMMYAHARGYLGVSKFKKLTPAPILFITPKNREDRRRKVSETTTRSVTPEKTRRSQSTTTTTTVILFRTEATVTATRGHSVNLLLFNEVSKYIFMSCRVAFLFPLAQNDFVLPQYYLNGIDVV